MAGTGSMMQGASYKPSHILREVAPDVKRAVVLFVDVQNYNCHKAGAMYRRYTPEALEGPEFSCWWSRIDECTDKWAQLQQAARACNIEVMYTITQSLTADGRERSMEHKLSGFHVPPGCWDAKVVDAITPGPDEVVLPKSSSSVFTSTTLDYILRNMDKRFLIIAGCSIDQSLAHAVKDAADLGYMVTLVSDCCATFSSDRHIQACEAVGSCCRQRTLAALLEEIAAGADMTDHMTPGGGFGGLEPNNAGYRAGPSSGLRVGSGGTGGGLPPLAGNRSTDSETFAGDGDGSPMYRKRRRFAAGVDRDTDAHPGGGLGGSRRGARGAATEAEGDDHDLDRGTFTDHDDDDGDDDEDFEDGDDDDDDEGSDGQDRPRGPESSRQAAQNRRNRGRNAGNDGRRSIYFEYAKPRWENERDFLLPDGTTWVDVAIPGDPSKRERGLVFCRVCKHYNLNNVMARGYTAGKRCALTEHSRYSGHRDLVASLQAGGLNMAFPKVDPETLQQPEQPEQPEQPQQPQQPQPAEPAEPAEPAPAAPAPAAHIQPYGSAPGNPAAAAAAHGSALANTAAAAAAAPGPSAEDLAAATAAYNLGLQHMISDDASSDDADSHLQAPGVPPPPPPPAAAAIADIDPAAAAVAAAAAAGGDQGDGALPELHLVQLVTQLAASLGLTPEQLLEAMANTAQ